MLNRRLGVIDAVFLMYPADTWYTGRYCYRWQSVKLKWSPGLAGIYYQGKKWGLILGVTSHERDFLKSNNDFRLREMTAKVTDIQALVGASSCRFAGILDGLLRKKGIVSEQTPQGPTVDAILKAEKMVERMENLDADVPLVVLGARGFVGAQLVERLQGREVHEIDLSASASKGKEGERTCRLGSNLAGRKALLINVARRSALTDYSEFFWPGLVILNEAYPPPSSAHLRTIKQSGVTIYHLSGIRGTAYPAFPGAYSGSIPCCAASRDFVEGEVVVHRL